MGILKGIKKVGKKIGKVATKAAPFVGMIPGVGTLAAAGIGAAGGLLSGKGVKGALKYGALGAAGNIGANLLGKVPGVGSLMGKAGLNAKTFKGGISALGSTLGIGGGGGGGAPNAPVGAAQMGGGDPYSPYDTGADQFMPDIAGGGGGTDWAKILGMAGKVAPLAMGAAGAFQNAQQATQNRQLTQEQVQQARDAIARQKMLQDQALNPINVQAPDYSSIFGQTQNPFYRPAAQAGG